MSLDVESEKLLTGARQSAEALLDDLIEKQSDLNGSFPGLDAHADGRAAMSGAVDSARRVLACIDEALQSSIQSSN